MKNVKIVICYDGTRYNGWQKQGNTKNTIQEKLEETISKMLEEEIELAGSGRTDAGVHALGQVANFHVSDGAYEKLFKQDINQYLPQDIRFLSVSEAPKRFHARLNATGKHYSYWIDNGEVADVFRRKYLTRIEEKLDVERMKQGAGYFLGEHDFMSFCANKKMKKSTVRTITRLDISQENGIIRLDFYGNGFLYNMIRIIVGTLIEIGLSKREPEEVTAILAAKNRAEAGYLAPASGLFLEEVYYGTE